MTGLVAFHLALRFALREMRGGFKGFYVFLACIMLGVAAIGAVNGITRMMEDEFRQQGQAMLGADMRISMNQRPLNAAEYEFLARQGSVAESISMRSMIRRASGDGQALAEIKAIDKNYPLYGAFETSDGHDYTSLFGKREGYYGLVAPQLLLDRLGLKTGDLVDIGDLTLRVRASLVAEPDLLSEGFLLGQRVFMAKEAMALTGLMQPGSLFSHIYKLKIPGVTDEALRLFEKKARESFPDAGWAIRTRLNAAPVLTANFERFSQFFTLMGLTALAVGGMGAANAVEAYLARKEKVIATFKSLGATGRFVILVYLSQMMMLALAGVAAGLALAIAAPPAAACILREYLPAIGHGGIYPPALGLAAAFALMITLACSIAPLGRTCNVRAAGLFRKQPATCSPGKAAYACRAMALLVSCAIAGLAVVTARDKTLAAAFILAGCSTFALLRLLSGVIRRLARRCRLPPRSTALRLAISNLRRAGALLPAVLSALGLSLTLLVALATIDGSLRRQLAGSSPHQAPSFFFLDIPGTQGEAFRAFLAQKAPGGSVHIMPTLRARIVQINGVAADKLKTSAAGRWVLQGDRNVTYAAQPPAGAKLAEGTWWPQDYDGEPLVSFSDKEAAQLGLKIGDKIAVSVLGRLITATIASLRTVDWNSFNMNFVMIFSPNTLAGAPHIWLATLKTPDDSKDDGALMRAVGRDFPSVTVISVRETLEIARKLLDQGSLAMRAGASIALLASILVLAGALAAGNSARAHDAVILKALGATRGVLIRAFVYEYAIMGLIAAVFAFGAGSLAGWLLARFRMGLDAVFLPQAGVTVLLVSLLLSTGLGLAGTWRVLGQKPSPLLREL